MSTIPRPGTEVIPRNWQTGLAPVYIGMFLWFAFFDQIGDRALPLGGLGLSILGAAVAGPLGYLLLFRAPANWGFRARRPLKEIATSTFGIRGAALVPGLLLGVAQILVFAVAVGTAIELTFQGLVQIGFVPGQALRPTQIGGATLKSPLYLLTALFWAIASALVSLKFIRWIGYLMQFFPIFPAVMLGGAMLASLGGLRSFVPSGVDPLSPGLVVSIREGSLQSFLLTFQWVFAFSSMAGVMGADWGFGSIEARDVRIGGWLGMGLAPVFVAILALISIAGYQGSKEGATLLEPGRLSRSEITELSSSGQVNTGSVPPGLDAPSYTFRAVLNGGFDRRVGGLMLMTFGLASMAPAVYSSFMFGTQFKELGPAVSRLSWTMLGTCAAWLLIVGGWLNRNEVVFSLLGAAFAPVAGAITADYRRHKGQWTGPRSNANPAGLIAWGLGFAVGLSPLLGRAFGSPWLAALQPAALFAFLASYLTYEILALVRLESAWMSSAEPESHG